ncbi:hypothetical protein CH380_09475 [Leptospira adleri]|uniref:Uncharacterized protein n=1 Tax=Leptospira adleri TaxID=2023186 RepID=A0A2M9YPE2_9LEPT|nr:hypothetical protein CH380_09475 [Leptospira adleri]PJZ62999.1 hypothetical protein CH376_04835 [Leptospira adleri]
MEVVGSRENIRRIFLIIKVVSFQVKSQLLSFVGTPTEISIGIFTMENPFSALGGSSLRYESFILKSQDLIPISDRFFLRL